MQYTNNNRVSMRKQWTSEFLNPWSRADSRLLSQEINPPPNHLSKPKVRYRVHESLKMYTILCKIRLSTSWYLISLIYTLILNMTVSLNVASCSPIYSDRRFRQACYRHHQGHSPHDRPITRLQRHVSIKLSLSDQFVWFSYKTALCRSCIR